MARAAALGAFARRDPYVARMVGLSAALHAGLLFVLLVVVPLLKPSPLPIVAYTVELTDSSSLGGRLAPGPANLPMGPRPGPSAAEAPAREGAPPKPEPAPKPEPVAEPAPEPAKPEPPKPVETAKAPEPPKPIEPAVKLPSVEKPPPPKPEPKPEAKKPEPKPEPKPEAKPKVEAKKPEPPKPTPAPEAKPTDTAKAAKPTAPAKPETKPADAKPSAEAKPAGKPGGKPDGAADGGTDAYAAAAEKWRSKSGTGGGGGLGGTDTSPGPAGTPGYGGGGGGQVVGFEFLAYQQRVVSTVKGVWTNAAVRPGLVAKVRFQIAPDGEVSGIRLEQASGDTLFDGSVMRAVQRANPLPAPPARYVNEFREFMIEFHSEEGGQLSG